MTDSFPYKKVLVLGATSGIGEALAKRFVHGGAKVIAVGRRKENLVSLVDALGHGKVSMIPFDITDIAEIPGFVKKVTEQHPDLDYILFNSGIQRKTDWSNVEEIDLKTINLEFTTNYLSQIALTKGFLPFFESKQTETAVCYVTSGLALVPMTRCSNYCATKAAMHHFSMTLRESLSGTKVKVYELLPPAVQTELHDTKHQPDMKNGREIGMPLDKFTDEAYAGLVAKKDFVPVGRVPGLFDAFENKRQESFHDFAEMMKKG